ncbi:MAG: hypothetical protein V4591_11050 [Bdellovibrionota bacterium]
MVLREIKKIAAVGMFACALGASFIGCSQPNQTSSESSSESESASSSASSPTVTFETKSVSIASPVVNGVLGASCTQYKSGASPAAITTLLLAANNAENSSCTISISSIVATVAGSANVTYTANSNLVVPINSEFGAQSKFTSTVSTNPNIYVAAKMAWSTATNAWQITINYQEDATLLSSNSLTGSYATTATGSGLNSVNPPNYVASFPVGTNNGKFWVDSKGYLQPSTAGAQNSATFVFTLPSTNPQPAQFWAIFPSWAIPSQLSAASCGISGWGSVTSSPTGTNTAAAQNCFINYFYPTTYGTVNPVFVWQGGSQTLTPGVSLTNLWGSGTGYLGVSYGGGSITGYNVYTSGSAQSIPALLQEVHSPMQPTCSPTSGNPCPSTTPSYNTSAANSGSPAWRLPYVLPSTGLAYYVVLVNVDTKSLLPVSELVTLALLR